MNNATFALVVLSQWWWWWLFYIDSIIWKLGIILLMFAISYSDRWMLVFRRDEIVSMTNSKSSSGSSLLIKCVYISMFLLSFDWLPLFLHPPNKQQNNFLYKIFLFLSMMCIHVQCFSVLNSNNSHKRFLSKGFYILFSSLNCFEYFLFDMCLSDVSLMYMKGSMNELVFAFGQVILFSFFFILSYFNITKTLIIKISMLWFWCWDIYDQLINQCLWVLRKEVHKKKKEANQPKTKT